MADGRSNAIPCFSRFVRRPPSFACCHKFASSLRRPLQCLPLEFPSHLFIYAFDRLHLSFILVTMLWLTGFCNVSQFQDGINGLAGARGSSYGMALFCCPSSMEETASTVQPAFGGGCLGFVFAEFPSRSNLHEIPAVYFSDSFLLCWLFRLAQLGTSVTALVLVVSVFCFDSGFTLFRRLAGKKTSPGHRSHLYQRLVQAGVSQPACDAALSLSSRERPPFWRFPMKVLRNGQRFGVPAGGFYFAQVLPLAVFFGCERRARGKAPRPLGPGRFA